MVQLLHLQMWRARPYPLTAGFCGNDNRTTDCGTGPPKEAVTLEIFPATALDIEGALDQRPSGTPGLNVPNAAWRPWSAGYMPAYLAFWAQVVPFRATVRRSVMARIWHDLDW